MSEDHPNDADGDCADGGDRRAIDGPGRADDRSQGPTGEGRSGDDRAESGTDPETLAERAAEIRAELDRWETSEDAGDDVDLADAVENIQRWTTGDAED